MNTPSSQLVAASTSGAPVTANGAIVTAPMVVSTLGSRGSGAEIVGGGIAGIYRGREV